MDSQVGTVRGVRRELAEHEQGADRRRRPRAGRSSAAAFPRPPAPGRRHRAAGRVGSTGRRASRAVTARWPGPGRERGRSASRTGRRDAVATLPTATRARAEGRVYASGTCTPRSRSRTQVAAASRRPPGQASPRRPGLMIEDAVTRTPTTVRWTASATLVSRAMAIAAAETRIPTIADDVSSSSCGRQMARPPSTTSTGTARRSACTPRTFKPLQTNPAKAIGKTNAAIAPVESVRGNREQAIAQPTRSTPAVNRSLGRASTVAVATSASTTIRASSAVDAVRTSAATKPGDGDAPGRFRRPRRVGRRTGRAWRGPRPRQRRRARCPTSTGGPGPPDRPRRSR